MSHVLGTHRVTAIASDPQRNLDFYAGQTDEPTRKFPRQDLVTQRDWIRSFGG